MTDKSLQLLKTTIDKLADAQVKLLESLLSIIDDQHSEIKKLNRHIELGYDPGEDEILEAYED